MKKGALPPPPELLPATQEVLGAMAADSGISLTELRVDGGMSVNNFLMQFQADIFDATVVRTQVSETTALGAAYAAGRRDRYEGEFSEGRAHFVLC